MNRIVVDTNIAFSAFLNINSRIGQILLNGTACFEFFAPNYLIEELIEHKVKIMSIGKLEDRNFVELFGLILRNIRTLNHSLVPKEYYKNAFNLCKDIDVDDVPFIAINDYVRGSLWTGDQKLIKGLSLKGYNNIVTTNDLFHQFIEKNN